jgi:hypothetical protein
MNAKEAAIMRETLGALGYDQPATPIISDNSFADYFTKDLPTDNDRRMRKFVKPE